MAFRIRTFDESRTQEDSRLVYHGHSCPRAGRDIRSQLFRDTVRSFREELCNALRRRQLRISPNWRLLWFKPLVSFHRELRELLPTDPERVGVSRGPPIKVVFFEQ